MLSIEPTGAVLGATCTASTWPSRSPDADFAALLRALGEHRRAAHPRPADRGAAICATSRCASARSRPASPAASTTGRCRRSASSPTSCENGEPIGLADAGQDWHTDMSYTATKGFVNVLYAVKVPMRDGRPLGDTLFANMHAAYDDLPAEVKQRLAGMTAPHDFNVFWENMRRRPGSARAPLTPEQRAKRPPAVHPVFMTHPITGRTVLYCNPGYAERINWNCPRPRAARCWTSSSRISLQAEVPVRASLDGRRRADLGPSRHAAQRDPGLRAGEQRLMLRCQVMAETIFDPGFQRHWLKAA